MAGAGAGAERLFQGPEAAMSRLEARVAALSATVAAQAERQAGTEAELRAERQTTQHLAARVEALEAVLAEVGRPLAVHRATEARKKNPNWRDWGNVLGGGLPEDLLVKVAETLVAQTEAGWAAHLKKHCPWYSEEMIPEVMAVRKRGGNCLFIFAMVCKGWRQAQLAVGGPLRTRVDSDVAMPGSVALAKWALAEGCPMENENHFTMAAAAAQHGHRELVRWLCGEGGFAMDLNVMDSAAKSGNLELVRWLRGEGCKWDFLVCERAVEFGHVEVLRWLRENGCEWRAETRDKAAAELAYTDDFGNLYTW